MLFTKDLFMILSTIILILAAIVIAAFFLSIILSATNQSAASKASTANLTLPPNERVFTPLQREAGIPTLSAFITSIKSVLGGSGITTSDAGFIVQADKIVGSVKSFNDVQGAPRSLDPSDADLTDYYKNVGVRIVRIPQDDGFNFTLAGIFPDSDRDPDDPSAYNFEAIDRRIALIIAANASPLWEAGYDIGGGDEWKGCCQGGRPPMNNEKWSSVIRHVLMHWNEGWANGYHWNITYVEFINEPFGLGGFSSLFRCHQEIQHRLWAARANRRLCKPNPCFTPFF